MGMTLSANEQSPAVKLLTQPEQALAGLGQNAEAMVWDGSIAVALFVLTIAMSRLVTFLIRRGAKKLSPMGFDTTLPIFLSQVAGWLVILVGMVAVLHRVGVETTSILAVLGAASLAIGLALQGTLGNVASGLMLLVVKPYRIGDIVQIGDQVGRVKRLGLFNTEIESLDSLKISMTNTKVFEQPIVNYTANGQRRVLLDFEVHYDSDLDQVLDLMRGVATNHEKVLPHPLVWVGVQAYLSSSVQVRLHAWCAATDWLQTRADLLLGIKKAFDAARIVIPYPHQVALMPEAHPLNRTGQVDAV
ncbi:MAG: mechanosensitive ion channel family protein [Asticcacaulis sp.]